MADVLTPAPTESVTNDPTRFLIGNLCALLETYLEPAQIKRVYRAYLFSAQAHQGQKRLTGEPYIDHPLAVAHTMAEMRMDADSIIAGLLHDVIEDTPTAKEQLAREFGRDVAELVDGVSKLTHLKFESKAEAQAENFRKMMLAIVKDLRVIMVKLADRLHNMRTVRIMPPEKRRRIARETHDIVGHALNVMLLSAGAARRTLDDDGDRITGGIEGEHQRINELLAEMDGAEPGDAAFDERVRELFPLLRHDVRVEEDVLLARLSASVDQRRLDEVGAARKPVLRWKQT
jgi:GTP pyrophosphokinase